jgi:hypothetical protein
MFNWTKRGQTRARLVEADASALIIRFGDYAYDEARRRGREADSGAILDGNRPDGHWHAVRRSLAKQLGRDGLDTATGYLMDR